MPFYRGTRYALLAAGGVCRSAVSVSEEEAEGDALGTLAAAETTVLPGDDDAEPLADAGPAAPIRGISERTCIGRAPPLSRQNAR